MDRFFKRCKVSSKLMTREMRKAFAKYGKHSAVPTSAMAKASGSPQTAQMQSGNNSAVYWFWIYMMRHQWKMPKKFTHPRPALMP